jgi:uncharacterized protein
VVTTIDRSTFLRRGAAAAAGLAIAGPLTALRVRTATGAPVRGEGYGPLVDMGELALPRGFRYRVVSREGDPMSDGSPTPGIFDGMAAFRGAKNTTILIRNHENRRRAGESPVIVPAELRYDRDPTYNGGCTKLVVTPDLRVSESFAILGGTSTNCAGGPTPWGSWITCEEVFDDGAGGTPHGYNFEVDAFAGGPVRAEPIRAAGRFVHEAVGIIDQVLYQTEDRGLEACLYRYVPDGAVRRPGDLARSTGTLQALKVAGNPAMNMSSGVPVGRPMKVEWVTIDAPEPATDTVRAEAKTKGAALFDRQEGCWVHDGRLYFDCTEGGPEDLGQVWELDPGRDTLTLVYESPGADELKNPDNLVVTPRGDLILCEDADPPMYLRLLTLEGEISEFARAIDAPGSEFCGACFDPSGRVLFVNQQGDRGSGADRVLARTYAITGPWMRANSK